MILRHPRDKSTPPLLSHPTTALSNHRFPTPIPSDTPLLLPIPIPSEEYESLIRFAPSQRPCRSLSRPSLPAVTTSRFPTAPCRPRIEESFESFGTRFSLGSATEHRRIDLERKSNAVPARGSARSLARLLLSRNPKRAGSAMLSSSLASPRNREGRGREKWNERARNVTTR